MSDNLKSWCADEAARRIYAEYEAATGHGSFATFVGCLADYADEKNAELRARLAEAESDRDALRRALGEAVYVARKAREFIVNGVEYGYIRMPDADTPDAAHKMLPMIDALVARHAAGENGAIDAGS